jgi:hypothetical protein
VEQLAADEDFCLGAEVKAETFKDLTAALLYAAEASLAQIAEAKRFKPGTYQFRLTKLTA